MPDDAATGIGDEATPRFETALGTQGVDETDLWGVHVRVVITTETAAMHGPDGLGVLGLLAANTHVPQ